MIANDVQTFSFPNIVAHWLNVLKKLSYNERNMAIHALNLHW